MAIVTKLTLCTTAIKNAISEARKVQVLCLMVKQNKCNDNLNNLRVVLKQAVQIKKRNICSITISDKSSVTTFNIKSHRCFCLKGAKTTCVEITNAQFQCSLKFLAHINMF